MPTNVLHNCNYDNELLIKMSLLTSEPGTDVKSRQDNVDKSPNITASIIKHIIKEFNDNQSVVT